MPPPVLPSDFSPATGPAPSLFDTAAAAASKGFVQHSTAEDRRVAGVVETARQKLLADATPEARVQLMGIWRDVQSRPEINADPTQGWLSAMDIWRERLPASERGSVPTRQQLIDRARQMDLDQYTSADRVLSRGTGLAHGAAEFAGGVAGAMADPVNLAALAAFRTPAASILKTAAFEAMVGGVSQAAIEPFTADYMNDLGIDYDWRNSAQNILYAGAGGAVFGGGVRAIEKGVVRLGGGIPIDEQRAATAAAGRETDAADWRAAAGVDADARALAAENPYVGANRPSAAAAELAARHQMAAVRASEEIVSGAPVTPERPPVAGARDPATVRRSIEDASEGRIEYVDLDTLQRDPARFQYKDADADGVTSALKDVDRWDPEKAGVIMVWEDADGGRFVVNGHQRHHLASQLRAGGHEPIGAPVYVLREGEGVSAEQAMIKGAMTNLAEGSGSPIDAAIVLRNAGDDAVIGLPPNNPLVRDATGLAALGDDAFHFVAVRGADAKLGAQVGRLVEDKGLHVQVLDALERMKPNGQDEAAHMIRDMLAVPVVERETIDLFGTEMVRELLIAERAKIKQAALLRLAKDKGAFRVAVQRQVELEARGNKLARDQNMAAMDADTQAALRLEKEAHVKGWVSDALNDAARRLRDGDSITKVVDDAVKALRAGDPGGTGVRGADGAAGRGAERAGEAGAPDAAAAEGSSPDFRRATQKELKEGGAAAYVTELISDTASVDDMDRVLAWLGRDSKSTIEDAYRALTGDAVDLPAGATKASVLSLVRDAVRRSHAAQEPIDAILDRLYAPDPDIDRFIAADAASRAPVDEGRALDVDARQMDEAGRQAAESADLDHLEAEIRARLQERPEGLDDTGDLFLDPETGKESSTALLLDELDVDKNRVKVLEACAFAGGKGGG